MKSSKVDKQEEYKSHYMRQSWVEIVGYLDCITAFGFTCMKCVRALFYEVLKSTASNVVMWSKYVTIKIISNFNLGLPHTLLSVGS